MKINQIVGYIWQYIVRYQRLLTYLSIGTFTNLLDIGIYIALLSVGIYYLISSVISSAIAISLSFILHKWITFAVSGNTKGQIFRFTLGLTFNYFVSQFVLYILVSGLSIHEIVSRFLSIIFVVSYNYLLLNRWVFSNSEK